MADETEDVGQTLKPSSHLLPSISHCHPLSSPSIPTNDLPGLSNCHSCGLHYPPKTQKQNLQTLESHWRIVLLCNHCFGSLQSAKSCSYCFSPIRDDDGGLLNCRSCSRRVHIRCVPIDQGIPALLEINPDSFICVDCCPIHRSSNRNPSGVEFRLSLEDLVRRWSSVAEKKSMVAARAKERAVQKVAVARQAADRARSALDAVVEVKEPRVKADEELALRLHLAMNGSKRVLRNPRSLSSNDASAFKRSRGNENMTSRKTESCSCNVEEKVEFSTEDKAFLKSDDNMWLNPKRSSSTEEKDQEIEDGGHNGNCLVETSLKEEPESCSNTGLSFGTIDTSIVSIYQVPNGSNGTFFPPKCEGDDGENFSESKKCSSDGRFKKKYSKRNLKVVEEKEEHHLVTCRHMSCSEASGALSNAAY